jgi:hypothetical protein
MGCDLTNRIITGGELYDMPENATAWLIDGLLPLKGLSMLVGKPKSGKSCLLRQLVISVLHGEKFLGRDTTQAPVFYIALEEYPNEAADHMKLLGLQKEDKLFARFGAATGGITSLDKLMGAYPDIKLFVIDPIFLLVKVRKPNDYAPVIAALEQLGELAGKHGVHISTSHHLRKAILSDSPWDSVLGSTGIRASIETNLLLMTDGSGMRSIETEQRYGRPLQRTLLNWDSEKRAMNIGMSAEESNLAALGKTQGKIAEAIKEYVVSHAAAPEAEILTAIPGRTETKKEVLRALVERGEVKRTGRGVAGDAYLYVLSPIPVEESI